MIKAIETEYKGYRFRSRLEARWAVFFDTLGLRYEYEPEGYDLGEAGWYLPDFYLPDLETWIEVKPNTTDSDARQEKIAPAFVKMIKQRYMVVKGDPMTIIEMENKLWVTGESGERVCLETPRIPEWEDASAYTMHFPSGGMDFPYLFCVCPVCSKISIEFSGRGERVCGSIEEDGHEGAAGHKNHTYNHPRILAAAKAARQARFDGKKVSKRRSKKRGLSPYHQAFADAINRHKYVVDDDFAELPELEAELGSEDSVTKYLGTPASLPSEDFLSSAPPGSLEIGKVFKLDNVHIIDFHEIVLSKEFFYGGYICVPCTFGVELEEQYYLDHPVYKGSMPQIMSWREYNRTHIPIALKNKFNRYNYIDRGKKSIQYINPLFSASIETPYLVNMVVRMESHNDILFLNVLGIQCLDKGMQVDL